MHNFRMLGAMSITQFSQGISIFILLIMALPLWAVDSEQGAVQALLDAELLIQQSEIPPPHSAAWQAVTLTDRWSSQRYDEGNNGWYRLVVNLPQPLSEPWGIYLRRFNMNAAIFLNGQFLGDGGSFDEPLSRNWNRPLYVTAPPALWQLGENVIHIRLKSDRAYGYLAPVFIGPVAVLNSEYKQQNLYQIEISQTLFPVMVAIGLFIFGLWLRRRKDTQYLWFSLAVLMWSIFSLNMFIKDQPFSTKTWEWIAHSSLEWWVILFSIFIYRFINKPHPRLERFYLLFGLVACSAYAWADLEMLSTITRWFHGGGLLIGFMVLAGLVQAAWHERSSLYTKLAIGLALLLLLGINDWMFQYQAKGVTGDIGLHLHHYFSPFIFLFMAWHLTGRFVTALNEAERLNRELESRILAATNKLEHHHQAIREMEQQQAVLQERERLSHEIHDGISGNVANAIMMTELICREAPPENGKRLRQLRAYLDDGLCEMRNLVLTMEEDLSTISELISHINDKYEQVLVPLDIDYSVTVSLQNGQQALSQKESLNLLRIFQEALNNIAKHAQASQVLFQVREENGAIIFEVSDNGQGFCTMQQLNGHYGLGNMHKRSHEIGAYLAISSTPNEGTHVQLVFPARESLIPNPPGFKVS